MLKKSLVVAVSLAAGICAAPAAEPASADKTPAFVNAFAGSWATYDPALTDGGACVVELQKTESGKNYVAKQTSCAGPLSSVTGWGIVDQQLALLDTEGAVAARLGGNQNRISGTLKGGSEVIFERKSLAEQIHSQWSGLGCVYLGYTSKCAPAQTLAIPGKADAAKPEKISVLVKLNARAEPRPDASVVSVIAPKACLPVQSCTVAANGAWCKVLENGKTAWISHKAVRMGKYPIVTFVAGCQ